MVNGCDDSCCSVTTLARYECWLTLAIAADLDKAASGCRFVNEPKLHPAHTSLLCTYDRTPVSVLMAILITILIEMITVGILYKSDIRDDE